MNYFAHGFRFLHDPYFVAGTAVPDWLSVVDRKVRARSKGAQLLVTNADPQISAVARGIVQHHFDDDWFHQTRAFAELNLQFTVQIRDFFAPDDSMRPGFLGHILVEILLDADLIEESPERLTEYYRALAAIEPEVVSRTVATIAKSTSLLGPFIPRFCAERFLYDYAEDGKLLSRLNMVMRRVRLSELPDSFRDLLPEMRRAVKNRRSELLPDDRFQSLPHVAEPNPT